MKDMRSQLPLQSRLVLLSRRHYRRSLIALGCTLFSLCSNIDNKPRAFAESGTPSIGPEASQPLNTSTKKINEVTIPATHNSFNHAPKFELPNVNESVSEQLENGVRALELDPNYLGKEILLFHGLGGVLGTQPVSEVLAEVLAFLQQNPSEIVVIKMHSKVPSAELAALVDRAGLAPYLFALKKGEAIPTPAELVKDNRRLLITNAGAKLSSRLSLCTTRWNLKSPEALWPPREHRREKDNLAPCKGDFFSVIAFAVDAALGTGSLENARVINDYDALLNLTEMAWKLNGKKIWRIEVDFPDIGNVYKVADTLNRWNILKGEVLHQGEILPQVSWNCQYSQGETLETDTYGRFSFPMKPDETVTLTPSHPDFVFSPASVSITNTSRQDISKNFTATRR